MSDCPAINATHLEVNTTATSVGTAVGLQCRGGYRLRGEPVLVCTSDGYWSRLIPSCIEDDSGTDGDQVALIAICVVATLIALGVFLLAMYMLLQNCRKDKKDQTKDAKFEQKMKEISIFFEASQESDPVGMPAYVPTNRSIVLKGKTHTSESSTEEAATTNTTTTPASPSTSDLTLQDSEKIFVY